MRGRTEGGREADLSGGPYADNSGVSEGRHQWRGWVVVSELRYQGGELFGCHETIERDKYLNFSPMNDKEHGGHGIIVGG